MAAWAQGTAQINGVVKDSSGSTVPGASVKATQSATGAARTATTGADGAYVLTTLPIGPYILEVTKDGFSKYVQSGIVLQVAANPQIDAVLKIGSVNEQVTIQADAAMVETQRTGVGTVVDNQRVVELPLNGRNATELIFLAGMATVGTGPGLQGVSSNRNYPTVVVNVAGGIQNGITYLLDGTNHNDMETNNNLPLPFPDALQEFKVETSALPAQYGLHSSAAVNAVTKSGTNGFHGDAFDFLRNGDLNARDFFAPTRDTLKRNQFGGTIGGPIRKDKLFFFVGYQGTRERSTPTQDISYVPTAAVLAGDYTAFASAACNGGKQVNLSPAYGFVNNQISPSLYNQSAVKIAALLAPSTDPCGKINFGKLANDNEDLGLSRIDYQKSDRHSMFGRLYIANLDTVSSYDGHDFLTFGNLFAHDRVYSAALGDTFLIGSGMVSSFRVGVNRAALPKIPDNIGTWKSFGVNATSFPTVPFVGVAVSGGNGFSVGGLTNIANTGPSYNVAEDFSWVKGTHQFGFGGNYLFTQLNYASGVNATGSPTFNGQVTGLGMADYFLGDTFSWHQGNVTHLYNRQKYFGFYAQDSWKVRSRLTINYGVRWEPYIPMYSKYGWWDHFDPSNFAAGTKSSVYVNAPAGEIFPGDSQWQPSGNHMGNNRLNTFAPRIGVVWDPTGSGRMTVRAAYGMFTDRLNLYEPTTFIQDAPYGNSVTINNVNFSNPWANYPGGDPYANPTLNKNVTFPTAGATVTYPFNLRPTYSQQWNLSIQRQVGTDWLFTANYLGGNTIHLVTENQLNPAVFLGTGPCTLNIVNTAGVVVPTPQAVCSTTANTNQRRAYYLQNPVQGQYYGIISVLDDGGTASYNGLLVSGQKRLSHGVTVLSNFTLSHCISDVWNANVGNTGASSITPNNRYADRSNCYTGDQRYLSNTSIVAQTPKFANRALRWIASDWSVSPIMVIRSSQFFTVTSGIDTALTGQGSQRPNLLNLNPYPTNQSVNGWINASAFGTPAPGSYGNLGNFNLKGPGVFQFDIALSRTFPIREKQTFQIRAEAFNLPNHLNPSVPVAATNNAAFGKIQSDISGNAGLSAGDPRLVQVALKFVF